MALPTNTFFDESYYLLNNPDIFAAVLKGQVRNGYEHFVQFGAREGRTPSQVFSSNFYLSQYPDVAAGVANGSLRSGYEHFVQFGAREGRDGSPLFSSNFYLNKYPDIAASVANGSIRSAFDHFLEFGAKEGRDPSLLFSSSVYLSQNPDVANAASTGQISAFEHYILYGQEENRSGVAANKFDIEFDYTFDNSGFFADPSRKATLQAAANIWKASIQDEFKNIPVGNQFRLPHPQTGEIQDVTLSSEIDDLRIYVGAAPTPFGDLTDALAAATTEGFDSEASIYNARLNGSKFQPFIGVLSFNSTLNWFFDPTPNTSDDIPNGSQDFFSVALHEMGHILGIGSAPIFRQLGNGGLFNGPNAKNVNGGNPLPLESELGHIKDGYLSDGQPVLMDPTYPNNRIIPTRADLALLADIGYRIPNFQPQGSTLPISTPNADNIFGTVANDVLNGNAGNDNLLGNNGADILRGGGGDDIVSGEDGNDILYGDRANDRVDGGLGDDILFGGLGDDTITGGGGRDTFIYESGRDRIPDFSVSGDIVQVGSGLGFTTGADVFRAINQTGRTDNNLLFSVVTVNSQNTITIVHDTALTAANFTVVG